MTARGVGGGVMSSVVCRQVHGDDKHRNDLPAAQRFIAPGPFVCPPGCFAADNQGDFHNKIPHLAHQTIKAHLVQLSVALTLFVTRFNIIIIVPKMHRYTQV